MKHSVAVLVCALALLALGVTWFVRRETAEVERAPLHTSTADERVDAAPVTQLETPELVDSARSAATPVSKLRAETPSFTALETSAGPPLPPADGPRLHVIGRSELDEIPNALVYWFEDGDQGSAAALLALGPEHVDGPWPRGVRAFVADEAGWVRLPRASGRAFVVGFAPGRSAAYAFTPDANANVYLRMEDALFARVVTRAGAPAVDIPVEVVGLCRSASTDAHGRVRLVLSKSDVAAWAAPTRTLRAQLGFREHVELIVPTTSAPDRRWTLTLPELGALRVCVPDAASILGEADGNVSVYDIAPRATRDAADPRRADRSVRFEDGCARIERLPIGREYRLVISFHRLAFSTALALPGPVVNDGEVVHEIRLADRPIVRVRLLDVHGEPVRSAGITVELDSPGVERSDRADTDAEGRVYVLLDQAYEAGARRVLEFTSFGALPATLDLSRDLADGVTDLGDVQLGPPDFKSTQPDPFHVRRELGQPK